MTVDETSRTRIEGVTPPTPHWTEFDPEDGRLVDIRDASFYRGRIVLHGVRPENEHEVRALLRPFSEFVDGVISRRRFDDLFEVTPEPLRWSECVRVEERCTLFLSPWHIDNAFHLHANNLLPMFANLRQAGLLDSPRLLYLHPGDRERNARSVMLWELMAEMFARAVECIGSLEAAGGRVGFRRIRWGRGPLLLYLRDIRGTPFVGACDDYRRWALKRLDVAEREGAGGGVRPRVLYMVRSGARSIANRQVLLDALAAVGLDVTAFDGWSDTSSKEFVSLVHGSDILMGVHGAGLAHMAYMPRGSMTVELVPPTHTTAPVFPHAAHHFGHRHVRVALTGEREPPGGRVLSPQEAVAIARRVADEWEARCRPRTITVRSLGAGNWGNEVFWYMFGKAYARRYGLEFQVDRWVGNDLVGADDPPVRRHLPDVVEETEHGITDTVIPHGPPMGDVNFVGYFQYHTAHYAPDRDYIRSLFQPAPAVARRIEPHWRAVREGRGVTVALHIRRRDYGFRYFYRAPAKWYLDLLDRLWPELDRPILYVATDDPDSVLGDFAQYHPVSAADLGPPWPAHDFYRDFYALQHSDVLAISNSSFSFAAAMLNSGLQRAYRPHLPSRRMVPFDPWDDKPLQQEPAFQVERYPWLPDVWRPTPAWRRWAEFGRSHARGARSGLERRIGAFRQDARDGGLRHAVLQRVQALGLRGR